MQGHTAFSSPASANAYTHSSPAGILVLHKASTGHHRLYHNNIVPLPVRFPSPIPLWGGGGGKERKYHRIFLPCI